MLRMAYIHILLVNCYVLFHISNALSTWLSDPPEVSDAVEAALRAGYTHIDCAHVYGNELFIGESLQKCFKEGVCKREDIFVTSKLW